MIKLPDSPKMHFIGDPLLFEVHPDVPEDELDFEVLQHNIDILLASQVHFTGVGIAAPQIGWRQRVFTFGLDKANPRYPDAAACPIECWVNPKITWFSEETCWAWEGCLSAPGFRGWIERPTAVTLKGLNRHGEPMEKELTGFMARVVQHEMDHLDGILFPQRVTDPGLYVPLPSFEQQSEWAEGWPSPGSYSTRPGGISPLR